MSVQEERLRLGYKLNGQAAEGSLPFFLFVFAEKRICRSEYTYK